MQMRLLRGLAIASKKSATPLMALAITLSSSVVHATSLSLAEAIALTLQNQPQVRFQDALVAGNSALLQQTTGEFDWTVAVTNSYGRSSELEEPSLANPTVSFDETILFSSDLSAVRRFRNGVSVQPRLTLNRIKNFEVFDPLAASNTRISVNIPLLKGSGEISVTANERAASSNLEAAQHTRVHEVSKLVLNTVLAYWKSQAAYHSYHVQKQGLSRAEQIMATIENLVAAGEIRAALKQRAQGEVNLRLLDLENSREAFKTSLQILAQAIGLTATSSQLLSHTDSSMPTPSTATELPSAEALIELAMQERQDLMAAQKSLEAVSHRVKQKRQDLNPQLDLALEGGYQGARALVNSVESLNVFAHEHSKPDYGVSLTLRIPLENNLAKGQLAAERASLWQAQELINTLRTTIPADIRIQHNIMDVNRQRYAMALDAEQTFAQLSKDIVPQVLNGVSDLGELVDIEDRLIKARLNRIDANRRYAEALARIRFASGTMTEFNQGPLEFVPAQFNQLPI